MQLFKKVAKAAWRMLQLWGNMALVAAGVFLFVVAVVDFRYNGWAATATIGLCGVLLFAVGTFNCCIVGYAVVQSCERWRAERQQRRNRNWSDRVIGSAKYDVPEVPWQD